MIVTMMAMTPSLKASMRLVVIFPVDMGLYASRDSDPERRSSGPIQLANGLRG